MDGRPPTGPNALTERQIEVASLVARGLSNREIGEVLGISLDGAKFHVSEIMLRLSLQRRDEIAEWYRREGKGRRWTKAAIPFGWVSGVAVAGAGAFGAVLIFVLLQALSSNQPIEPAEAHFIAPADATHDAAEDELPSLELPFHLAEAQISISAESFYWRDTNAIIRWSSQEPSVEFVSPLTGETVASITLGESAVIHGAQLRTSTAQLLVSDRARDGTARLWIFDLEPLPVLRSAVLLPGQRSARWYSSGMITLSADESVVAYVEHRQTPNDGGCGTDLTRQPIGSGCDYYRLVAVDLRLPEPMAYASAELPVNCYPSVEPRATGGFMVRCSNTDVTVFDSELRVVDEFELRTALSRLQPHHGDPVYPGGVLPPAIVFTAGVMTQSDEIVAIGRDGVAISSDGSSQRVLPEGMWLKDSQQIRGSDRYVFAYGSVRNVSVSEGAVVVDLNTMSVEASVQFAPGFVSMSDQGDIFVFRDDETMERFTAGRYEHPATIPVRGFRESVIALW